MSLPNPPSATDLPKYISVSVRIKLARVTVTGSFSVVGFVEGIVCVSILLFYLNDYYCATVIRHSTGQVCFIAHPYGSRFSGL